MGIRRTGPYGVIYADTTIPGTDAVAMEAFTAAGNTVAIEIKTTTGGCGDLTITAERSIDGGLTFGTVLDEDTAWAYVVSAATVAGTYLVDLPLQMAVGDVIRLSYAAEVAAGKLQVRALNYHDESSGRRLATITGSIESNNDVLDDVHNELSSALRVEEVNPLFEQYVSETLADVTNGTDGTYYYYVDMSGFRGLVLQLVLDGGSGTVTATVEGTLQDDGTAPASCIYQDVTQYGMDILTASTAAASYTGDEILSVPEMANYKYLRVKIVANSGANDGDWTIYSKAWY